MITPIRSPRSKYDLKTHDFKDSIIRGMLGEKLALKAFYDDPKWNKTLGLSEGKGYFQDVSEDRKYQSIDVDKLLYLPNGLVQKHEIKTDDYLENIFFETVSNIESGVEGWVYKTRADYVQYNFIRLGEIFILPFPKTQEWLDAYLDKAQDPPTKTIRNKARQGGHYHSLGHPLNRHFVKESLEAMGIRVHVLNYPAWTKSQIEREISYYKEKGTFSF